MAGLPWRDGLASPVASAWLRCHERKHDEVARLGGHGAMVLGCYGVWWHGQGRRDLAWLAAVPARCGAEKNSEGEKTWWRQITGWGNRGAAAGYLWGCGR